MSYDSIKSVLKSIIPTRWLFRIEPVLRTIYTIGYSGSNVECNVCHTSLSQFIEIRNDKMCPKCGSLRRNRRLAALLKTEFLVPSQKVLDFSPSRCIYRWLSKELIDYTSTDLSTDFIAHHQYDITAIPLPENHFDLILCYHILEHVANDLQAMKELYRVLKPNGTCLIQTPFKDGDTYEDASITTEADRLEHFGQADHVRIYSVIGLKSRLEQVGFHVDIPQFPEPDMRHGLQVNEVILICRK